MNDKNLMEMPLVEATADSQTIPADNGNRMRVVSMDTEAISITSQHHIVYPGHDDEEAWTRLNNERVELIHKQLSSGLTEFERQVLDRLEAAMIQHNDVIAPLPWGLLDRLDTAIQQLTEPQ